MQQKPLSEIRAIADVEPAQSRSLTRRERLERWADLLDREPSRQLKTLHEIELQPRSKRGEMRADGSPLSVAYADPVLRTEGLASDKLGDAIAFFELSDGQVHRLLCSCMYGVRMEAGTAARQIRTIARGDVAHRSTVVLTGVAVVVIPALLYFFT